MIIIAGLISDLLLPGSMTTDMTPLGNVVVLANEVVCVLLPRRAVVIETLSLGSALVLADRPVSGLLLVGIVTRDALPFGKVRVPTDWLFSTLLPLGNVATDSMLCDTVAVATLLPVVAVMLALAPVVATTIPPLGDAGVAKE